MDYKYFREGLISLSTILLIFSLSFLFSSIFLKPYIALEPKDRDFIVGLTIINLAFNVYYLVEAFKFERVFKLEEKHILRFGIRMGIITLCYAPHIFIFSSLLLLDLHNLQIMMIWLILIIEGLLLGVLFKEIYDLVLKDEMERKFEIDQNRKVYLERK
ncbi:MAG: hypothetical protein ACFE96_18435 [Candidatus Hermodarchaeota archaeon]